MIPLSAISGLIGNVGGAGKGGQATTPAQSKAEASSNPYTTTTTATGPFESGAGQRGPIITIGDGNKVNPGVQPAGVSWLWLGGGILVFLLFVFLIIRRP